VSELSPRVSDADRERAVHALREHLVEGRLTLDEFSRRVEAAFRAGTADELAEVALPAERPSPRRRPSYITAGLFAHIIRRGRLRLPRRAFVVSGFADVDLDLRGAEITSGRTSVIVFELFGNVDIYVPEGISVDVSGLNVFGHRREWGRDPTQPDAPVLRVRVFALFGTLDVWRVPAAVKGKYREIIRIVRAASASCPTSRTPGYAPPVISFARGVPAPECLAVEGLADCARAALERDGRSILSYGPGGGYGPLREWLAERHGVESSRVVITSGSLQGFVFLAEQLVEPGTRVLVEAPTYDRPLKILTRLGAEIVTVPMDEDGLVPEELPEGDFAFLYTIPTFQNPSGRTMSVERRRRLAELARERQLLVLEDDPYGLVRYEGEPLPSVFELADGEQIAYCSSFSKTVAPGLRVGWFVLPAQLAAEIEALAVSTYISPPYVTQATVLEFLQRKSFEPNLQRVNGLLRDRRDAMLEALERELPDDASWTHPEGGYFVWVELPSGPDSSELLAEVEKAGVTFVKGSDFFPGGRGGERALRLAFSFVSPDEIAEGVSLLASLVGSAAPAAL
jgi:2-aminoadipate transaminase